MNEIKIAVGHWDIERRRPDDEDLQDFKKVIAKLGIDFKPQHPEHWDVEARELVLPPGWHLESEGTDVWEYLFLLYRAPLDNETMMRLVKLVGAGDVVAKGFDLSKCYFLD